MNRKIVLAFVLGALSASAVFAWIQAYKSPVVPQAITAAPIAPPHPSTAATTPPTTTMPMAEAKAGSIDTLTDGLRARLEKEPNDVNGWVLLARSYHFLQRFDEAKAAFAKAKSLGYQGEEDQAPVNGADNGGAAAVADPVFESVARAAQQAARLRAPADNGAGK